MKKVILFTVCLIFITSQALAIEKDKLLHFQYSAAMAIPMNLATHAAELPPAYRAGVTLGGVMMVGVGKELSDDKFDWKDVQADAIGAVTGWLLTETAVALIKRLK